MKESLEKEPMNYQKFLAPCKLNFSEYMGFNINEYFEKTKIEKACFMGGIKTSRGIIIDELYLPPDEAIVIQTNSKIMLDGRYIKYILKQLTKIKRFPIIAHNHILDKDIYFSEKDILVAKKFGELFHEYSGLNCYGAFLYTKYCKRMWLSLCKEKQIWIGDTFDNMRCII